ncbi:MAG: hypothetical protein AAFX87_30235 [Bacteroidota bacterium]
MKKKIIITALAISAIVLFFSLKKNSVTVYIANGDNNLSIDSLDVALTIDDIPIFQGKLGSHRYAIEMFEIDMRSGVHSLSIKTEKGNAFQEEKFFIVYDQHVVLEFYSNCEKNGEGCFDVRNRFRKFMLE